MILELSLLLAKAPQIDQLIGNVPERTRIIWEAPEMSLKAYETGFKFPETGLPVGEALEIIHTCYIEYKRLFWCKYVLV